MKDDLKQEFKNAEKELQQTMGMLVTKFDEVDWCIGAMDWDIIVLKTEIDNVKTYMNFVKKKIGNVRTGSVENLNED